MTAPDPPAAGRLRARAGQRFWGALLAILILALLVRVAVVLTTPDYRPQTDSADYDRIALSLAQHHSFPDSALALTPTPTAFRGPLFPMALAGAYKLVGVSSASSRWEAGRLLEALLGTIAVALVALIARRLWGSGVALLSGLAAAVYPPLVLVGSSLMSESLYIPLVLGAVLAALVQRDRGGGWRWALVAGALIGLLALTRANGIALVIPLAFLVWTQRPRWSWSSLRPPLVLVATAAVMLIPWTVRNYHAFGELVPITTEGGYATVGEFNDYTARRTDFPAMWTPPILEIAQIADLARHLNEAQLADRLNSMAVDYLTAHPTYLGKVVFWNTARLFGLTGTRFELSIAGSEAYPRYLVSLSVYSFWVLGLLALLGILTGAARRTPLAFWACPVVIFLSCVFIIGSTRYRAPADPFLIMLAAAGCLAAVARLRGRPRRRAQVAPVS